MPPGAAATHAAPGLSSEEPWLTIPEGVLPAQNAPAEPGGARDAAAERQTAVRPELQRSSRPQKGRWLVVAVAALVAAAVALIVFVPAARLGVLPGHGTKPEASSAAAPILPKPAPPAPAPAPAAPAPAAGRSSAADAGGPSVYVVAAGDTLWAIAARLTGDPYQFGRLAIENGIADPDRIVPGQIIRLPRK
jgi:nucleoid-associated protein YgaU